MMDKELLELLRSPDDRSPVHLAERSLVDEVNRAIAEGRVRNRMGDLVEQPIEGGLVSESGEVLFPIVEGLPMMVVDEAIPLAPLRG